MKNNNEKKALRTIVAIISILASVLICCSCGNSKNKASSAISNNLSSNDAAISEISDDGISIEDILSFFGFGGSETLDNDENETDELRKKTVAEILSETITIEVYEYWDYLSTDEKEEYLNEYYVSAGEELGVETLGVVFKDLPGDTLGYNNGNGYIYIDSENLEGVEQLPSLLNTVTHEMRHQLQNDAINDPEAFPDIPEEVLEQWAYEWDPDNYINPEDDYEGYYYQELEIDARDFAECVVEIYMETLSGEYESDQGGTIDYLQSLIEEFDFNELFEQFCNGKNEVVFYDYVVR